MKIEESLRIICNEANSLLEKILEEDLVARTRVQIVFLLKDQSCLISNNIEHILENLPAAFKQNESLQLVLKQKQSRKSYFKIRDEEKLIDNKISDLKFRDDLVVGLKFIGRPDINLIRTIANSNEILKKITSGNPLHPVLFNVNEFLMSRCTNQEDIGSFKNPIMVTSSSLNILKPSPNNPIRVECFNRNYSLGDGAILWITSTVSENKFWAYDSCSISNGNNILRECILKEYPANRLDSYRFSDDIFCDDFSEKENIYFTEKTKLLKNEIKNLENSLYPGWNNEQETIRDFIYKLSPRIESLNKDTINKFLTDLESIKSRHHANQIFIKNIFSYLGKVQTLIKSIENDLIQGKNESL
jgi:hypothetical protein